jgi:hypothetical protein
MRRLSIPAWIIPPRLKTKHIQKLPEKLFKYFSNTAFPLKIAIDFFWQ